MTRMNELERSRLKQITEVLSRVLDYGPEQLNTLEAAINGGIPDAEESAGLAVRYIAQLAEELGEACAEFGKPAPAPVLRVVE